MGQVFAQNSVTCEYHDYLTYLELTHYYNELVLQLSLAEHDLKVAINSEVKQINRSEALEKQREIIELLNESILPALKFTVS